MENGGGRDLEEKETFLLARNPIYDQEWLWDNEVLSLFLFSFRQSLRSVSFKEERSSCTTITQKLEKTGFGWRGFFSLKNHSPKCKKKKKRCCCTTFFPLPFLPSKPAPLGKRALLSLGFFVWRWGTMQKNLFQREEAELLKKKSCCPILAPLCQNGTTPSCYYCLLAINNMGVEIVMQQDEEEEENSNG